MAVRAGSAAYWLLQAFLPPLPTTTTTPLRAGFPCATQESVVGASVYILLHGDHIMPFLKSLMYISTELGVGLTHLHQVAARHLQVRLGYEHSPHLAGWVLHI